MTADGSTRVRSPWWLLGALSLPLLALSVDVNGVGIVLPEIAADLHLDPSAGSWVMNASPIAFAAVLIVTGRLADRIGRRGLLLSGVAGFGLASLVCAVAPNVQVLVAGRVSQGVASAMCFTTSLAVVDSTFDAARRGRAIGIWGAIMGIGGAIGPLVGGALTTGSGWRSFFAINVGLCLVVVPILAWLVPPDAPALLDATARGARRGESLTLVVGLALLMIGVQGTTSGRGVLTPAVLVPLGLALGLLVALIRHDRGASPPLIPRAVLRASNFGVANVVGTCGNWAFGVVIVFVAVWLQRVSHLSALGAGVVFIGFSGSFAVAGVVSARFLTRLGAWGTLTVGSVLGIVGVVAIATMTAEGALPVVVGGLVVSGFGLGIVFDASTTVGLEAVGSAFAATAAGVLQTARLVGLVIGIALSTWVQSEATAHATGSAASRSTAGIRASLLVAAAVLAIGVMAAAFSGRRAEFTSADST